MKRDKVVYIPYPIKGNKINEYTTNMVDILKRKYSVSESLAEPVDFLQMLQTKAVFLNWIEGTLNLKMKIQLLLYRLCGAKIVWVFHNKQPHESVDENKVSANMLWIANNSSIILLHSKSSKKYIPHVGKNGRKAHYLPHVLYKGQTNREKVDEVRKRYGIATDEFVFTIFGLIRPYKNIEGGIAAFNSLCLPKAKLLIAGKPISNEYAKSIEKLCDNNNIVLDMRYLPNELLDSIVEISDVIVLPYKDSSSMNSGVMIQAFSRGKTVIAPDICMARDMRKEFPFYLYRSELAIAMKKAYRNGKAINKSMGEIAQEYMQENNSPKVVEELLNEILE